MRKAVQRSARGRDCCAYIRALDPNARVVIGRVSLFLQLSNGSAERPHIGSKAI
jgi:hypothetical protein